MTNPDDRTEKTEPKCACPCGCVGGAMEGTEPPCCANCYNGHHGFNAPARTAKLQHNTNSSDMRDDEPPAVASDCTEDVVAYTPFDDEARDSLLFQRNMWRKRAEEMQRQLVHYRDHMDVSTSECALCIKEDEERDL